MALLHKRTHLQPPARFGLRQLSAGYGAFDWEHRHAASMAPAYTTTHFGPSAQALETSAAEYKVAHAATALRTLSPGNLPGLP
jgi:hypothetical protein